MRRVWFKLFTDICMDLGDILSKAQIIPDLRGDEPVGSH